MTFGETMQDILLSAPVQMTMRASVAATSSNTPLCAYYNETTGSWEEDGLVTGGATVSTSNAAGLRDLNVTCWSFHFSDFTILADEVGAGFEPVELVRTRSSRTLKSYQNCRHYKCGRIHDGAGSWVSREYAKRSSYE